MNVKCCRFPGFGARMAIVACALMLVSCASHDSAPGQVPAANQQVTFEVSGEAELARANENAAIFCKKYQSVPRTSNVSTDPSGKKVITFECVRPQPEFEPPSSRPVGRRRLDR
jgi:hypothetical protein